jgi:hypothetical protein
MSAQQRRLISFAGSTVAVEYEGPRPAAIVDFLYRDVLANANDDVAPHVTYRITSGARPGRMALYRGSALIYEGESEAVLAELLLGETCHHLAERSQGGLLFHAAGLAWRDRGLLLPGGIGVGKTTLAAWLVTRDLDYLTDELVFVPQGTNRLQPFTRPLNLKHPSSTVLQNYLDLEEHAAYIWSTPHADLVPPTALRSANRLSEPPLRLIIFPRHLPASEFVLRPLSGAQAGLALMECLINARNLPGHGLSEIARLARAAPAYRMHYANFEQIRDQIDPLLRPS